MALKEGGFAGLRLPDPPVSIDVMLATIHDACTAGRPFWGHLPEPLFEVIC